MSDLNLCLFIGRLGQDPETKHTAGGNAVTNFSIACSDKWRDKQSGEQQERTEWIRCVAFGKPAEIIGQYVARVIRFTFGVECKRGNGLTRTAKTDGQPRWSLTTSSLSAASAARIQRRPRIMDKRRAVDRTLMTISHRSEVAI